VLKIVLGMGVLLLFAGIVIRALAAQRSNLATGSPLRALGRAAGRHWAAPDHGRRAPGAAPDHVGVQALPNPAGPRVSAGPERAAAPRVERPGRPARADVEDPWSAVAAAEALERELTRVPPVSVRCLGRVLDEGRRLNAAEERVAGELAALPAGLWLVERNVWLGGRRIPFLALGVRGIFVICATDGAWTLRDLHVLCELGDDARRHLPGYDGPVHAAVCLAFDAMKPRSWYGGLDERGRGGWVLGLDWLHPWMLSQPEHGLLGGDIRRLDEAAGPFWERRSTVRLPATRNAG